MRPTGERERETSGDYWMETTSGGEEVRERGDKTERWGARG
jgi:hypothetical protein